ncbi:retrovirus-related pol polyprotein from transposon tnt 1-94 [Lasius niger]|uniref:Retrovirus-related pol polyprotein from transposon tnt 1-94 n=1 Tax=Lasius niger TaxID=67767 RepID=A0A0J7K4W2_LASNI|nr:retrovirus-related pol polyprotein from transposon tnt 1-94 [Lasius niger]
MVGDGQQCYNKWLVDSGASEHMTFDRTLFVSYSTLLNKRSVIIGDGRKLDAVGVGQIVVKAFNGKCYIETTLNNVLHVPDLKMNLFSVASAVNKGYSMKADINKCEFVKGNKVGAIATRDEKFYILDFKCESSNHVSANVGYSLKDWHEKMAHQNFECVKDILKKTNIKFSGKANTCTECLKGKQHRLPFQRSESSTSKVGELVHADVCGPIEEASIGGSRYFLLLKDDYSNYRTVYFVT